MKHTRSVWDSVSESQQALIDLRKKSDALVKDVQRLADIQLPPDTPRFEEMLDICAESISSRIKDSKSSDVEEKESRKENSKSQSVGDFWTTIETDAVRTGGLFIRHI